MKDFVISIPQNIVVGLGSMKELPKISKKVCGTHAFIISGPNLTKMGLVATCSSLLEQSGLQVDSFTETEANPSTQTVEKATKAYLDSGADFIVALGGGSPMDLAKAVGVIATYGGDIVEYEGGGKVPGEIVPLIAIPTTAGTGSEVTAFSVITDISRNYKLTIVSNHLLPSYVIIDATLITTAPFSVAAACGMDALVHAMEAYVSTASSIFTDMMAEQAMKLIGKSLCSYVANRKNLEAAENMLLGSLFAGIAFSTARLGNVHAMSHPVSAFFHVSHGVANAVLLPIVLEYNALADTGKYEKMYKCIFEEQHICKVFQPSMLVTAIRDLNDSLKIPRTLTEVGVTEDKIEVMAEDAMKSGNIAVNPRSSKIEDIIQLYRKSL